MNLSDLKATLSNSVPPEALDLPLQALWWSTKGDWDQAHGLIQDEADHAAAWVHAYLHRLEGDLDNAAYWYRQARQPIATGSLDTEWDTIVATLLTARR